MGLIGLECIYSKLPTKNWRFGMQYLPRFGEKSRPRHPRLNKLALFVVSWFTTNVLVNGKPPLHTLFSLSLGEHPSFCFVGSLFTGLRAWPIVRFFHSNGGLTAGVQRHFCWSWRSPNSQLKALWPSCSLLCYQQSSTSDVFPVPFSSSF